MKPYLFVLAILYCHWSSATCMLSKITIDERAKSSQTIIDGEITAQHSFWNTAKSSIFTVNTVQVNNRLKGSAQTTIEIITPGGELDGKLLVVEPNAELLVGSKGVFFLKNSTVSLQYTSALKQYEIYSLAQGFIEQDIYTGKYRDPFDEYSNRTEVYGLIGKTTGFNYRSSNTSSTNSVSGGTISSISPAKISAGTQSVLTITGTGFGTRTGAATVQFRDANSTSSMTFASIPDTSYIVSWTPTQIQVIVPGASAFRQSGAGTGQVNVIDAAGGIIQSSAQLTVTYNQFEYKKRRIALIGQNGLGGYTFTLNSSFNANADAKATFLRALDQWKCKTGVNVNISSTLTSNSCNNQLDNTNVITFADATCPLPAGALGTTYSTYSLCSNSPVMPDGMDMVFSPDANFYMGTASPASNQYDFESVILHELGHAFGQGHSSSGIEIMYPSIANGFTKRTLSPFSDLANIGDVLLRSATSISTCGFLKHLSLSTSCNSIPTVIVANFLPDKTSGCAPLTVNFTDKTTGNPTQWRWDISNNGTTDFTTQNPSYTFTQAGIYAVKLVATNATGKDSIVKSTLIVVSPPVTSSITTAQQITCNGSTGSVNAVAAGGDGSYTYLWSNNQTAASLTNVPAGTYSVTVKSGNQCSSTTTTNLTQPDPINVSVSTQLMNGSSNFSATLNVTGGITPYTFTLNNSSGSRIEASTQTISNLSAGNYTVSVRDKNNCSKSSSFSMSSPTGIEQVENSFDKLDVYPNPAINSVNINISLKEEKTVQVELFDMSGRTMFSDEYSNIKDKEASVDLSNLSAGTYILKFGLPEGNTFRKIVVNR
ncbi:MAG: hypothetical protein JWN78_44 [Bacteroidota bacterium]|nr:hypothetical protein [Bacteroidota bacterium]